LAQDCARYERNPDYIFRRIVDEAVLVPIHQQVADMDCIYTMNPVGAFVWEQLDGPATQDDLLAAMLDEYDADPEIIAADLDTFLGEMVAIGAIRKA
jgi:hypothetical protein